MHTPGKTKGVFRQSKGVWTKTKDILRKTKGVFDTRSRALCPEPYSFGPEAVQFRVRSPRGQSPKPYSLGLEAVRLQAQSPRAFFEPQTNSRLNGRETPSPAILSSHSPLNLSNVCIGLTINIPTLYQHPLILPSVHRATPFSRVDTGLLKGPLTRGLKGAGSVKSVDEMGVFCTFERRKGERRNTP